MRSEKKSTGTIRIRISKIPNQSSSPSSNIDMSGEGNESENKKMASALDTNNLEDFELPQETLSMEENDAPVWFTSYMGKFKDDMRSEIANDVIEKVSEILLKNTEIFNLKAGVSRLSKEGGKTSEAACVNIKDIDEPVHVGITCDNCEKPVKGTRFKCFVCVDYDLCEECDKIPDVHDPRHIFYRIRQPEDKDNTVINAPVSPSSSWVFAGGSTSAPCRRKYHAYRNTSPSSFRKAVTPSSACFRNIRTHNKIMKAMEHSKSGDGKSSLPRFNPNKSDTVQSKAVSALGGTDKLALDYELIKNDSIPDGSFVAPGAQFVKFWHVRNVGTETWGQDAVLRYSWGNLILMTEGMDRPVPPLKPGEDCSIGIKFLAPLVPGSYQSNWRLKSGGSVFGHRLTCSIIVINSTDDSNVNQKQSQISNVESNSNRDTSKIRNLSEMVSEIHIDQENGHISNQSLLQPATVTSNQLIDLDVKCSSFDNYNETSEELLSDKKCNKYSKLSSEDSDETASILSLSSCDSDSDYVKIPMSRPPCSWSTIFKAPLAPSASPVMSSSDVLVGRQVVTIEEIKTDSPTASEDSQSISRASTHSTQDFEINRPVYATNIVSQETGAPEDAEQQPDLKNQTAMPLTKQPTLTSHQHRENFQDNAMGHEKKLTHADVYSDNSETVQVLPEGLVTGALTAAASVYNTAKAIFSTIQSPEESVSLSQPIFTRPPPPLSPMGQLMEMGFCNRELNATLLSKHTNDVNAVVSELLAMGDNNWYATRHRQPDFD